MNHMFIFIMLLISFSFSDLIRPVNENLRTIHVYFEWEQEADAVEYNIQASNSLSFNSLYFDINLCAKYSTVTCIFSEILNTTVVQKS